MQPELPEFSKREQINRAQISTFSENPKKIVEPFNQKFQQFRVGNQMEQKFPVRNQSKTWVCLGRLFSVPDIAENA